MSSAESRLAGGHFTDCFRELVQCYSAPQFTDEMARLAAQAEEYIAKMGASWR